VIGEPSDVSLDVADGPRVEDFTAGGTVIIFSVIIFCPRRPS
jgi:hypothetical protein